MLIVLFIPGLYGTGIYFFGPFIKRMMTSNPQNFMDPDKIARLRKNIVYCDIPIPNDPEEEFDTDILVEWYKEKKEQGQVQWFVI